MPLKEFNKSTSKPQPRRSKFNLSHGPFWSLSPKTEGETWDEVLAPL